MARLRSDDPPCVTNRPRVPRASIRPSASRLESASRRTVREMCELVGEHALGRQPVAGLEAAVLDAQADRLDRAVDERAVALGAHAPQLAARGTATWRGRRTACPGTWLASSSSHCNIIVDVRPSRQPECPCSAQAFQTKNLTCQTKLGLIAPHDADQDDPAAAGAARDPRRGEQRGPDRARPRGLRDRLRRRSDDHGFDRPDVCRLPRGLRARHPRPRRSGCARGVQRGVQPRRHRRRRRHARSRSSSPRRSPSVVPCAEQVVLHEHGHRGHVLRRPPRARRDRPQAADQVPGLLPRLARRGRHERDLVGRARRRQGPALARDPARGHRRHARAAVQRPRRRARRGRRAPRARSRRSSSSRSRTTSAPILPEQRFLEGLRELCDKARHRADLRRGHHRLPARARRLPGRLRRHARPHVDGQGDGERLPDRRARRPRATCSSSSRPCRARPSCSPARTTATRAWPPRRWRRSRKLESEPVHEHIFRLGELARTGLQEKFDALGVPGLRDRVRFGVGELLPRRPGHLVRRPARQRRRTIRRLSQASHGARHLRAAP